MDRHPAALNDRPPTETGGGVFEALHRTLPIRKAQYHAYLNLRPWLVLKLLMLTAARATEIASLRWSEITDSHIAVSGIRIKNGRPLVVPLTVPIRSILDALSRAHDREYVFGRRKAPFSGWGLTLANLNARISETTGAPLEHWTPPIIRRSLAIGVAELGQRPHIIELILNHARHRGAISGIYNRSTYQREKLAALSLCGDHLLSAVEGKPATVVPFTDAVS